MRVGERAREREKKLGKRARESGPMDSLFDTSISYLCYEINIKI